MIFEALAELFNPEPNLRQVPDDKRAGVLKQAGLHVVRISNKARAIRLHPCPLQTKTPYQQAGVFYAPGVPTRYPETLEVFCHDQHPDPERLSVVDQPLYIALMLNNLGQSTDREVVCVNCPFSFCYHKLQDPNLLALPATERYTQPKKKVMVLPLPNGEEYLATITKNAIRITNKQGVHISTKEFLNRGGKIPNR